MCALCVRRTRWSTRSKVVQFLSLRNRRDRPDITGQRRPLGPDNHDFAQLCSSCKTLSESCAKLAKPHLARNDIVASPFSTERPTQQPMEALAESRDNRAAMFSSDSGAAERIIALERREASSKPLWFGEPLEKQKTAADMGFTVPVLLRALRRAMYAQDVFEVPGCFEHKRSLHKATKNALRHRLAAGEDPFVVCKPTLPVELLTSLLKDWLYELPGGLWGQELVSECQSWTLVACTPSNRKVAASKGNANLLQLMEKTLGEKADVSIDKVTRVAPLLDAMDPRRREVRAKQCVLFAQATPTSHSSQPHISYPSRSGIALAARDAGPGGGV